MPGMKKRHPQPPLRPAASPPATAPQAELQQLVVLFQAGRPADMEATAAALVARYPADGLAWKALGTAQLVQRKNAVAALQQAQTRLPRDVDVASNLGHALDAQDQPTLAAAAYRQALQLQPGVAALHSSLGHVLGQLGQWPEAEAACRQALRLQPGLVQAHRSLAQVLNRQGCWLDAAASLHQALALQPDHAPTHDQLGLLQQALGQHAAAAASHRRALQLQPGLVAAHAHLGQALAALGQQADAVACLRQALLLQPDQPAVLANLAVLLLALGQADVAVQALQHAVALQPGQPLLHSNLGNALLAAGRVVDALASHQQAVALLAAPAIAAGADTNAAVLHANLAHALKVAGQPAAALQAVQQALMVDPQQPARHSEALFLQRYLPPPDAATARAAALRYGTLLESLRATPSPSIRRWPNPPQPERPLRIGLLSPDLRQHPVGYFSESVLAALAAQAAGRTVVFAYANPADSDATSQRLRGHCQGWRDMTCLSDTALAAAVQADGIDILLDLAGHTARNRLPVLAQRAAPLQVSWLGDCASTGLTAVDAFLADPWIAPPGTEAAFVEPVLRLPETFLCFTPPAIDIPVGPLPALGHDAHAGGIRFACFNQLAKLNDDVLALWSRILLALPGSSLALQAAALQDPALCQQLQRRFAAFGVPAQRLRLQTAQSRAAYLAAYQQVDMALDPFPYPGGTTSLEALWMGVPVLTLPGSTALSRQGLSIQHNLGLVDWVASSADDYLARALQHAADLPKLAALRQSLRGRLLASPLCDAPRFALHLEAALRGLWRQWCGRVL